MKEGGSVEGLGTQQVTVTVAAKKGEEFYPELEGKVQSWAAGFGGLVGFDILPTWSLERGYSNIRINIGIFNPKISLCMYHL